MIKVIVFDFDGVLVDSNRMKHDVWFSLFPPEEKIPAELVSDVLSRIKETRFDILREIFLRAGREEEKREALIARYAGLFNDAVQKGIVSLGMVPGVPEMLAKLRLSHRFYVNSSTPEFALRESISRFGIAAHFQGIFGRPATKEENLQKIMALEKETPDHVVMVGDGDSDRDAAAACGCRFIGVANGWNDWKENEFPLISSVVELPGMLGVG